MLGVLVLGVQGWTPASAVARSSRRAGRTRLGHPCASEDEAPQQDEELSTQFSKFIAGEAAASEVQGFNDDLYAHLNQRPEYETSELYKNLRKRVDVTDPMYNELEKVKWGDLLNNAGPTSETTPGEAIETVLRALRDVDEPSKNSGLELLQLFSSSASALNPNSQGGMTPEQLREYFDQSKYGILLDWVAIRYTRKLDLSFDKRRAVQQLRLTGRDGTSVPVTFQMSQYKVDEADAASADVWLIDQLLVKSVDL